VALQPRVPELVDRAGPSQHAALAGIVEKGGQRPGEAAGERQRDPDEDKPLPPRGERHGVSQGRAHPADGAGGQPPLGRPAKRAAEAGDGPAAKADGGREGRGHHQHPPQHGDPAPGQQAGRGGGGTSVNRGLKQRHGSQAEAAGQRED
jgi:hypothetical protein